MFTIDHIFQLILVIIGTLAIPWAFKVHGRLAKIETVLETAFNAGNLSFKKKPKKGK